MAITDYKITSAQVNAVHVGAQPNVLRGTAAQNKQVFDNYSDMIVEHINNLIDFLDNDTQAVVDPDVLTLYASLGWTPDE